MKRKHRWVPTIRETWQSPAILHLDCIQLCMGRYWWGDSIIAGGQGVWSSKLEKKPAWSSRGEGRNWLCLWVIPTDKSIQWCHSIGEHSHESSEVMPTLLLQRPRARSKTKMASIARSEASWDWWDAETANIKVSPSSSARWHPMSGGVFAALCRAGSSTWSGNTSNEEPVWRWGGGGSPPGGCIQCIQFSQQGGWPSEHPHHMSHTSPDANQCLSEPCQIVHWRGAAHPISGGHHTRRLISDGHVCHWYSSPHPQNLGGCNQGWYADDASAGGELPGLSRWWDKLEATGPQNGYHPNPSKTWLVVKTEHLPAAEVHFQDTGIQVIAQGQRHLI